MCPCLGSIQQIVRLDIAQVVACNHNTSIASNQFSSKHWQSEAINRAAPQNYPSAPVLQYPAHTPCYTRDTTSTVMPPICCALRSQEENLCSQSCSSKRRLTFWKPEETGHVLGQTCLNSDTVVNTMVACVSE